MNQLNDAETGNADTPEQIGTTGGIQQLMNQFTTSSSSETRAKCEHVNEYNSFNLASVMQPVPPKWKNF